MIKELSEIYYSISDFCKSVDLRPTDDCMLREVMTNWRGKQMSKMRNNNPIKKGMSESGVLASKKEVTGENKSISPQMPSKKPIKKNQFGKPTEKMFQYCYRNNLDIDSETATYEEISQIISEHKAKEKKQ